MSSATVSHHTTPDLCTKDALQAISVGDALVIDYPNGRTSVTFTRVAPAGFACRIAYDDQASFSEARLYKFYGMAYDSVRTAPDRDLPLIGRIPAAEEALKSVSAAHALTIVNCLAQHELNLATSPDARVIAKEESSTALPPPPGRFVKCWRSFVTHAMGGDENSNSLQR